MAGSSGWAAFLMVLPRFDWMAISPSVFLSATMPPGVEPFQLAEAGEGDVVSVMSTMKCCGSEICYGNAGG